MCSRQSIVFNRYITDSGKQYSASVESIRAQSLALGDLYMTEGLKDNSRRIGYHGEQQDESLSPSSRPPRYHHTPLSEPMSNLSALFRRDKEATRQQETPKEEDETRPLLEQVDTSCSAASTVYHSIAPMDSAQDHAEPRDQANNNIVSSTGIGVSNKPKRSKFWITSSVIRKPISCIPAVTLGLLLNLLDAVSYGKSP